MMSKKAPRSMVFLISMLSLFGMACNSQVDLREQEEEKVILRFYGLFDNEEIYQPMIESYENTHPNIDILYKKFTEPEAYMDLIINEIAEGEGPDIFMLHNTEFQKHQDSLSPAPETIIKTDLFETKFVDLSSEDLIFPDEEGTKQVWGMPLYVDTLALYYNKAHFQELSPAQEAPSETWIGIEEDLTKLRKRDQSIEQFSQAGIALGRGDNILRAADIFLMLIMQNDLHFSSTDPNSSNTLEMLKFFTSFGISNEKNYTWNQYLSNSESGEKELTTFARGKLSMFFGYTYTYEDLMNEIKRLQKNGETTIDAQNIQTQVSPQIKDPTASNSTQISYASYFVPVVNKTSTHSELAWDFLLYMATEEDLLKSYHEKTHRPSALKSLISTQWADPIYGVFARQVDFAQSIVLSDPKTYKQIFLNGMNEVLSAENKEATLQEMAGKLEMLILNSSTQSTEMPQENENTN